MFKDREEIDKIRKIKKMIKSRKRTDRIINIVHNIIFVSVILIVASMVFDTPIANKPMFFVFTVLAGVSRYFVNDLQNTQEINDLYENLNMMAGHIIALDKAISEIQKLNTDEDILENTKREIFESVKKFNNEYEEK